MMQFVTLIRYDLLLIQRTFNSPKAFNYVYSNYPGTADMLLQSICIYEQKKDIVSIGLATLETYLLKCLETGK